MQFAVEELSFGTYDVHGIATFPFVLAVLSFVVLLISVRLGLLSRNGPWKLKEDPREDFDLIMASSLTLLGLIIGFSFSMALTRYDQRKRCEADEANAIGTEYTRADLLLAPDTARVRGLLKKYLDQRISFYSNLNNLQLRELNASTSQVQGEMWSAVHDSAAANPNAVTALAVSGMNDVLNSEGYTQAARWNKIPTAAWCLMLAIAVCCNLLLGYSARGPAEGRILFLILPLLVSISFLLMADLDSPHSGIIRVHPENLLRLSQSLR